MAGSTEGERLPVFERFYLEMGGHSYQLYRACERPNHRL